MKGVEMVVKMIPLIVITLFVFAAVLWFFPNIFGTGVNAGYETIIRACCNSARFEGDIDYCREQEFPLYKECQVDKSIDPSEVITLENLGKKAGKDAAAVRDMCCLGEKNTEETEK